MIRLVLVNTGSNALVLIVKILITLIMTPIFVHNLGKYDYGLWEMIGGVIGYMGMLDLGIRPAISRYAAKYKAEDDRERLFTVFASAFCFMLCIGVLLLIFFCLWGFWFAGSIAPEGSPTQRYTLLLLILGAQLLIAFPGYVAESYLEGFQKYYLKNNITIVNSIVGSIIIFQFITPENAILILAAVNALGFSIKYMLYFWVLSRSSFGAVYLKLSYFSMGKLKEIVVFGFKSLVQGIATRIENSSNVLIIGLFLGPAMVPFYSIPANLVGYMRTIGWTITHAFMPLFSDLSAKSEDEKILQVFLLASKYVVGIMLPMAIGVLMVGGPFIGVWVGVEFQEKGDAIIPLIVVFTALPFLNPFSSRLLTAVDKHAIFAKLMPVSAVISITLSLLLVKPFGIVGAACASVVPGFIFIPIFLRYTCRQLNIPVNHYIKKSLLPCVIPSVLLAVILLIVRRYTGMDTYSEILIGVIAAGLVWLPSYWLFALQSNEREYLVSRVLKKNSIPR